MPAPPLSRDELATIRRFASADNHPRLIVHRRERPTILERIESGLHRKMADRLRAKCDAYLEDSHEYALAPDGYSSNELLARPGQYQLSMKAGELAFAGWLFDDARYTEAAKAVMLRRAREAFKGNKGEGWCTYNRSPLGVGITGTTAAGTIDLLRPAMTDDEWADVVNFVRDYYFAFARTEEFERDRLMMTGFNKTLKGMCAMGMLGLACAEDLSDEDLSWAVSEARRSAMGYAREAMDDDGSTLEGPGYGATCITDVLMLAEYLRVHGLPEMSRCEPLHNYVKWSASILAPGGGTFALGDSHGDANLGPGLLLPARWTGDPAMVWTYLKGVGREDHRVGPFADTFNVWRPMLPQQIAWYDPDAAPAHPASMGWPTDYFAQGGAYVSMRSSHDEDAVAAVVIGQGRRPSTEAHLGHESGAVDLYAWGVELLHDPGYGPNTPASHSCVVCTDVDALISKGGNAKFGARVSRYASSDFACVTQIDMAQMRDCRWALRDVALVRGEQPYLVIADDLNYRSDLAHFAWYWQVPPGAEAHLPAGPGKPARIVNGNVTLDIHCFTLDGSMYPGDYQTEWVDEEYEPESWCQYEDKKRRLALKMTGYNGPLLSVLVPRRGDAAVAAPKVIPCERPGRAVTFAPTADAQDTIVFQPWNRFLETEHMRGSGRLAVVRESQDQVAGYALVDGYDLAWRGMRLVPPRDRCGEVICP